MDAIEFQAQVKDGIIQIPDQYRNQFSGTVKVIVLSEVQPSSNFIEQLLAQPIELEDFKPFSREEVHERR